MHVLQRDERQEDVRFDKTLFKEIIIGYDVRLKVSHWLDIRMFRTLRKKHCLIDKRHFESNKKKIMRI